MELPGNNSTIARYHIKPNQGTAELTQQLLSHDCRSERWTICSHAVTKARTNYTVSPNFGGAKNSTVD